MSMEKKSKNIQRIENWLSKIDWKLHNHGCGHYVIYDHNDKATSWIVYGDVDTRIYNDEEDFRGSCCFYLRDIRFMARKFRKNSEVSCLSIIPKYATKNPGIFLQFYNHDRD